MLLLSQQWRFEKMGGFLLKSHRSAKSLDPNHVCERALTMTNTPTFVQLSFNLGNGQFNTDLFKVTHEFIYTNGRQDATLIKWLIKS